MLQGIGQIFGDRQPKAQPLYAVSLRVAQLVQLSEDLSLLLGCNADTGVEDLNCMCPLRWWHAMSKPWSESEYTASEVSRKQ